MKRLLKLSFTSFIGLVIVLTSLVSRFLIESATWGDIYQVLIIGLVLIIIPQRKLASVISGILPKGKGMNDVVPAIAITLAVLKNIALVVLIIALSTGCATKRKIADALAEMPSEMRKDTAGAKVDVSVPRDAAEAKASPDELKPGQTVEQHSAAGVATATLEKLPNGQMKAKCNCKEHTIPVEVKVPYEHRVIVPCTRPHANGDAMKPDEEWNLGQVLLNPFRLLVLPFLCLLFVVFAGIAAVKYAWMLALNIKPTPKA